MKQFFIVLSLFNLSTLVCLAQDSLSFAKFDYNGNEFSDEMNKHVRKHRNNLSGYMGINFSRNKDYHLAMDTACEIGIAMIKFKVKSNGITELACTKTTNPGLARLFKEAVMQSSKYWKAKGNDNTYYILPIHYNFRYNCQDILVKKENMESYYIFNFDDGISVEEEQCVILKSLKFKSGIKEEDGLPPPRY